MENLLMNIIDESLNVEEKETWKVQDDLSADWCLDKIREAEAEYNRFEMVAKSKIAQVQDALQREQNRMNDTTSFFKSKLREYLENVKAKETKTQKTYSLPSGTLKLKKSKIDFDYNKDLLLEEAKKSQMTDLIKIKEEFNWSEFKKKLDINGTKIVNKETGEIVEMNGLKLTEKAEEFKVEV